MINVAMTFPDRLAADVAAHTLLVDRCIIDGLNFRLLLLCKIWGCVAPPRETSGYDRPCPRRILRPPALAGRKDLIAICLSPLPLGFVMRARVLFIPSDGISYCLSSILLVICPPVIADLSLVRICPSFSALCQRLSVIFYVCSSFIFMLGIIFSIILPALISMFIAVSLSALSR